MSLFAREKRSALVVSGGSYSPSSFQVAAGQYVSPETARQKIAYQASVNLLAGMASTLPVVVRRKRGGVMVEVPAPPVLRDPEGFGYGLGDFTYQWVAQLLTRGNVFCRTGPLDATARPTVVRLIEPGRVRIQDTPDGPMVIESGKAPEHLHSATHLDGIKHSRAYQVPGRFEGESVVANHARTLGLALAAEQFGAAFFGDGAHPTAIISSDQPINDTQASQIKERFMALLAGGREPAVLGNGAKFQPIQVSPEESQFLATQGYTDAQICRIFGAGVAEMLGYETGTQQTYANVQSRSLHLLIYALNPWLRRYEEFLSNYLLEPGEFATIDRNALLAMTATDRWNVHRNRLMLGAATINRILAEEGEAPVEWGDEPYLPSFLTASASVTTQAELTDPKEPQ